MTYVENPGSRLIKWRLKLKDYQYTFEYKKGKLNKGVEALSGNPTVEKESESDTENTDESDCPESISNEIPLELEENFIKVLVIHDRSERLKILPITRSKVAKERDAGPSASSTSIRQQPTGKITSILKRPILDDGIPKDSLKPSVPRKTSFKPVKSQALKPKQSLISKALNAKLKGKVKTTVSQENSEEIYIPPPGSKIPDPDVSGIAKRLTRRRKKIDIPAIYVPDKNLTSSDEQFSESSESSEHSDPPIFRKSRSVLPSLKPTIVPIKENSPPKSAPPMMPLRSPWLMSTHDQYVDVYIDGACSYNGSEESKAGIEICGLDQIIP